jgi:hypothetical protein
MTAKKRSSRVKQTVSQGVSTKLNGNLKSNMSPRPKRARSESQLIREEEHISNELEAAAKDSPPGRPPPVNTDWLPLPWKGRLGYVRERSLNLLSDLRRHASTHIFALRIRLSSAHGLVELHQSWSIDTPSVTLASQSMLQRTGLTKPSRLMPSWG